MRPLSVLVPLALPLTLLVLSRISQLDPIDDKSQLPKSTLSRCKFVHFVVPVETVVVSISTNMLSLRRLLLYRNADPDRLVSV